MADVVRRRIKTQKKKTLQNLTDKAIPLQETQLEANQAIRVLG
jgi:hypothetical protein